VQQYSGDRGVGVTASVVLSFAQQVLVAFWITVQ